MAISNVLTSISTSSKKYIVILFALIFMVVMGCQKTDEPEVIVTKQNIVALPQEEVKQSDIITKQIEIAPILVDCVGVALMKCMNVREHGSTDWQLFYDHNEGFEFEPGFTYQLKVQITPRQNPAADRSSIAWSLVELISKDKTVKDLEAVKD